MRKHVIRLHPGNRSGGEYLIESEKAGSHEQKEQPGRHAHECAYQRRLARFAYRRGGDVTLYHRLIAGELGEGAENSDQSHHHDSTFVETEFHRTEAEFVVLHADVENLGKAAGHLEHHRQNADQRASEQDQCLHHVGPDYRLDAAEYRVETGDHSEKQDCRSFADMEQFGERQHHQIEDDCEAQQLAEQRIERGVDPDAGAVAGFQIFIGGRFEAAPEERDENPAGDQRRDRHEEIRRQLPVVQHECRRREGEKGDRADRGPDHREAERPARNFASAEKILLAAVVAFQEIDAHPGHAEQEKRHD